VNLFERNGQGQEPPVNVTIHLFRPRFEFQGCPPEELRQLEERIMSTVSEQLDSKVAEIERSLTAKLGEVTTFVQAMRDQLAEARRNAVDPAQLAPLDRLDAIIDGFDPTKAATIPPDAGTGTPPGPTVEEATPT
jgi:hypothetical protein